MNKYQTLREKDHPENSVFPNIDTQNIPDSGVTTIKIADGAITTAKIATGAVTNACLATDAVDTSNIVAGAVTSTKIGANAVTSGKIASNAVTTGKIADGAVTTAKLADASVTGRKMSFQIVKLGDFLYDNNATDLARAITLIRDLQLNQVMLDTFYSSDNLVATINSAKISLDTGSLLVYMLKSGGWSEVATVTTDAELTTFMAGLAKEVYLKVMS